MSKNFTDELEKTKIFFQKLEGLGCSDHNCFIIGQRPGIHTNGGCKCLEYVAILSEKIKIKEAFSLFQKEIQRLTNIIKSAK